MNFIDEQMTNIFSNRIRELSFIPNRLVEPESISHYSNRVPLIDHFDLNTSRFSDTFMFNESTGNDKNKKGYEKGKSRL